MNLAPFFFEYFFYVDNHGGKLVVSQSDTNTFEPDIDNLDNAMGSLDDVATSLEEAMAWAHDTKLQQKALRGLFHSFQN